MRPFLLLATREDDAAADNEYDAFLRFAELDKADLVRVRLERAPMPEIDLTEWSGIFLGGGPYNAGDPVETKSLTQRRVEAELAVLLDEVLDVDFPFLGACYGIGTLGTHRGGTVDRRFAEPISRVPVTLTDAGCADALFSVLTPTFAAFVGHKEAVHDLPADVVLLASSPACPVQAFRIGRNVYATQFHPELDVEGLCTRIEVYKHAGYFHPDEAEPLKEMARAGGVTEPPRLLRRFVELHARN